MKVSFLAAMVLVGLLLAPSTSDGGMIYRFVDKAGGVVVFTDNPWQFEVYRRQLNEEPDRNPPVTPSDSSNERPRGRVTKALARHESRASRKR